MIPIQLQLTNFLSYRQKTTLDFRAVHLACISGANGAGKSSILDAITWALFGRSRSRSDDDLVNRVAALQGKSAEVRLIFDLEGNTYRITRRRRPRKSSMLELAIATDTDENGRPAQWKTLSESRIRETQAAIESLLRMNYDTFINASFLLQGKADEFTTKSPNRRKEILADLLGVSVWDEYRTAAADERKEAEGRQALLAAQLDDIETELAEEAVRKEALADARAASRRVAERLQDKEQLLEQLRRAEMAVQQQKKMVQNLAKNLAQAKQSLTNAQQKRQQRAEEAEQHRAILDDAESIRTHFVQWQEADAALQTWQAKAEAYNRLQQEKRPFELTITQEKSRLQQQLAELEARAERVQAARAERETVQQRVTQTRTELDALTQQQSELAAQEAAWHEARSRLQQLQSERKLRQQELSQLQTQQQRIQRLQQEEKSVRQNAAEAEAALSDLQEKLAAVNEWSQQHATALADLNSLQSEQPRLRARMDKMKARMDQLAAETGSECPLCGQPLSAAHRETVLTELRADGKTLGDQYRYNRERMEQLEAETAQLAQNLKQQPVLERQQQTQRDRLARAQARLAEIETAVAEWKETGRPQLDALQQALADDDAIKQQQQKVAELETAVQQKEKVEERQRGLQKQLSQAEARLTEIERLLQEWTEQGEETLVEVREALETASYAAAAQDRLSALDEQLTAVEYDAEAHRQAREHRDGLKEAPARHQALQQAEAAIRPLEDALADLDRQIVEQTETVAELAQQHEAAQSDLAQLEADGGDVRAVEDEVFGLREEQVAANRRVGAAQQRLDVLDDLRQRREKLQAERGELTQRIQRLKLLEKACGRNGVQALLIERALPEIEEHANELLERLTGGDMRVSFETQRQLKSRDALAETLDIRIIDSAGERPYDNYSGGEQFRVNFAIRLALSQVLANRAGARLQTLVIDEGFGSQDPNGRQRLVEAINTIQEEFERILVITHIDALRDAFPTRIEVEKTAVGSTIVVS